MSNDYQPEIHESFQTDLAHLNTGYDILSKIETKLKTYLSKPRPDSPAASSRFKQTAALKPQHYHYHNPDLPVHVKSSDVDNEK